jgi:hypothetical protein
MRFECVLFVIVSGTLTLDCLLPFTLIIGVYSNDPHIHIRMASGGELRLIEMSKDGYGLKGLLVDTSHVSQGSGGVYRVYHCSGLPV